MQFNSHFCTNCLWSFEGVPQGTLCPSCAKSEGKKYDDGKVDLLSHLTVHLTLLDAFQDVGAVLNYGKEKYGDNDNWIKVSNGRTRYLQAALRHVVAAARGEILDPESGLPHLAHAATSVLFALAISKQETK